MFYPRAYKWFCVVLVSLLSLSLLTACSALFAPSSPFEDHAAIEGVVTLNGKPVAGARVHAYEISEFLEEEGKDNAKIEEILRSQSLNDEDLPVEEWSETEGEVFEPAAQTDDYPEYRGPADFKSALTDADGRYSLVVSSGRYCFVARKRANPEIQMGPLTPEDYSSLLSKPVELEEGGGIQRNFEIHKLTSQTVNFAARYAIKTKETEINGVIKDQDNKPLPGYYVSANRNLKVSHKPDFFSDPGNEQGEYALYLPGGGVYYLALRSTPMGKPLPSKFVSEHVNAADNSVEILEGETLTEVHVILIPQSKGK